MNNTKFLLSLSASGEVTYHQPTSKQEILRHITPVLLPKPIIPKEVVKKCLPGLDDIAVCFTYPTPESKYTAVTHSLCISQGVTTEELMNALDNTSTEYFLNTLDEMLGFPDSGLPMYVLTNKDIKYGAGSIVLPTVRQEILNLFHGNAFYVLPSSIHEIILLPSDRITMSEEDLINMVRSVNRSQVAVPDRLSDHVYKVNADLSFSTIHLPIKEEPHHTQANFIIPNSKHDIAKAFLQGLDVKFETSQNGPDDCCFALYDLTERNYTIAHTFLLKECGGVLFPD